MPSIYLPAPRTWSPDEVDKAPYFRSDVSGTVQLLSRPPLFVGSQTISHQTLTTSGTDYPVVLDTETIDTLGGHIVTSDTTTYYAQFAGWYLCEGTAVLNYTGSTGTFGAAIGLKQNGVTSTHFGMTIPTAGFVPVVSVAKLGRMVVTGPIGGPGDWIDLVANQTSGSSQNLYNGTARAPALSLAWICALSGSQPLPVPVNAPWPPPYTSLTASASAGATSISVAAATGMVYYGGAGGHLGLDIGTAIAETVTLTANPAGLSVPVTALQYAHASGAVVNVPVSAAFQNQNVRDACKFLLYPPVMEWQYFGTSQTLASQSAVPAIGTTMNLDTSTFDNYGAFSTGSNTWTAPVAGVYYAYGQVAVSTLSTSQALGAGLTVTSANYNSGAQVTLWGGAFNDDSSVPGPGCAIVRRRLRLNEGDTVLLAGFQRDSGSNAVSVLGPAEYSCRMIMAWRSA